jgi:hypothetical protein
MVSSEDEGRLYPVVSQRGEEGHCFQVAVKHVGMKPLADRRPAARHGAMFVLV